MWTIRLLGGLAAHSSQRQITRFRTQKAASLLAYLAFHPAPQPRETLLALLWPDAEPEVGRHNLSNALSFLRHLLEPPGVSPGTVLLADRFTVRLNPAAVTTDLFAFENFLRQAEQKALSQEERLSLLRQAADLYQGPWLPGYYEEWIVPQAQRLESLFVQAVGQMVPKLLEAGQPEAALSYAQRAVTVDPLSEEAMLCLMQALSVSGQPAQALRSYRTFVQRLQDELDAEPSESLQSWVRQLGQSGSLKPSLALPTDGPPAEETACIQPLPGNLRAEEEQAIVSDRLRSAPRGRLVGGEFLLRTTTRFFDREEEIARLSKMLSSPRTRLVTLTGPGGIGKTRLALEAAAQLVEVAPSGGPNWAAFVPLADVSEAEPLFEIILRSLGMLPVAETQPVDQLVQVLAAQPGTLLILDNFEQLAEKGAMLLHHLLAKAEGVKLLVTSRQKLQIEGEHEFHLAPLPTSAGVQTPEALLTIPSIVLFVDRAQSALPDFQLTPRNAVTVSQLCDYLEGIPLALELAAARVAVLSPTRILEQVSANRLDFLTTRRRDAASRQRTLRATLDWS